MLIFGLVPGRAIYHAVQFINYKAIKENHRDGGSPGLTNEINPRVACEIETREPEFTLLPSYNQRSVHARKTPLSEIEIREEKEERVFVLKSRCSYPG